MRLQAIADESIRRKVTYCLIVRLTLKSVGIGRTMSMTSVRIVTKPSTSNCSRASTQTPGQLS
jgi:hypothetical protein